MKKTIKLFAVALALVLLTFSFVSCGIVRGDTVMEYEGYKITEAMYSYWKSHYKAAFISVYGTNGNVNWDEKLPNGMTYEQFFEEELVNSYAKKVLISQKLFDDNKLEFPEEYEENITEVMEGLESSYGGKNGLNAYLSNYNLNAKTLESIYYAEAKVQIVTDYIFGENGTHRILASDKAEYYTANYYCVNWIYIYTKKKPADTSAGTNSDGSYVMEDMSDTEKSEKKALVDDIVAKLQNGESFAELKAEYCEDKYSDGSSKYDYYPNGFNLSANDYDSYGVELIQLIKGMQIGDVQTYEDEYATRIIVRNPLVEYSKLTEQEKGIMQNFDAYLIQEKWDSIINNTSIKIDNAVAARYKVQAVKPFTNLTV